MIPISIIKTLFSTLIIFGCVSGQVTGDDALKVFSTMNQLVDEFNVNSRAKISYVFDNRQGFLFYFDGGAIPDDKLESAIRKFILQGSKLIQPGFAKSLDYGVKSTQEVLDTLTDVVYHYPSNEPLVLKSDIILQIQDHPIYDDGFCIPCSSMLSPFY